MVENNLSFILLVTKNLSKSVPHPIQIKSQADFKITACVSNQAI